MFGSLFIGSVFGLLWGATLSKRYRFLASSNQDKKNTCPRGIFKSCSFFSISKYILIAAILAILFVRYSLSVWWWLAGFMFAFWVFVILSTKRYSDK
jgi:hypothetical protein